MKPEKFQDVAWKEKIQIEVHDPNGEITYCDERIPGEKEQEGSSSIP